DQLQTILLDGTPIEWIVQEVKGIDYAMFTSALGSAHVTATYAASPTADFNRDGLVDAEDLVQWQSSFGEDDLGDADGDGVTDGADFLVWQRQFTGADERHVGAVVPEPASFSLLAAAAALCSEKRRLRRVSAR